MLRSQLSIPSPCSQDWDAMSPADGGRFCAQCAKVVRDFRDAPAEDIFAAYQVNNGELCIRVYADQLEPPVLPSVVSPSPRWRTFIAALVAVFSGWLFVPETKAQTLQPVVQQATVVQTVPVYIKVVRGDTLVPHFPVRLNAKGADGKFSLSLLAESNLLGVAAFKAPADPLQNEIQIAYTDENGSGLFKQTVVFGSDNFFVLDLDSATVVPATVEDFEDVHEVVFYRYLSSDS